MSPRGVYVRTDAYRLKQSISHRGTQPCLGHKQSEEHKRKIREGRKRSDYIHSEETRHKISESLKGLKRTEEEKRKLSATLQGIPLEEWTHYAKYEPYCQLFNEEKKEEIRNRYLRTCVISGESAIQNRMRLSVHHVDNNKMQGCDDVKWRLVPLIRSWNTRMRNHHHLTLLLNLLLINNINAEVNFCRRTLEQ